MSATVLAKSDQPAGILVLILRVAGQQLAVRQRDIAEVLPLPHLVPLPEAPPIVVGAFSLAGEAVFVLPMNTLLGLSGPAEGTALYHHLLRLPAQSGKAGLALLVDRVADTVLATVQPLPSGGSFNDCVDGEIQLGGALVPLLSITRLLTRYEQERLQAFATRESSRAAIFRSSERG